MTSHPVFRDFLRGALDQQQDAETIVQVRRRHADVLIANGDREEAVDELLRIGDVDAAARLAAGELPSLMARMDLAPAARWLDAIGGSVRTLTPEIGSVILRAAFALDQCGRGVELIDRHGCAWLPDPGDPSADETHVLVCWFLWQAGRIAEARSIADRMPAGRGRQIADTLIALATGADPPPFPEHSATPSGPLDGLLIRLAYLRGRARGARRPRIIRPLVHDSRGTLGDRHAAGDGPSRCGDGDVRASPRVAAAGLAARRRTRSTSCSTSAGSRRRGRRLSAGGP